MRRDGKHERIKRKGIGTVEELKGKGRGIQGVPKGGREIGLHRKKKRETEEGHVVPQYTFTTHIENVSWMKIQYLVSVPFPEI